MQAEEQAGRRVHVQVRGERNIYNTHYVTHVHLFLQLLFSTVLASITQSFSGGLPESVVLCFNACKEDYTNCTSKCSKVACPAQMDFCEQFCYERLYLCNSSCEKMYGVG